MKKIIFGSVAGIILIIGVAVILLLGSLDDLIAEQIEIVGTELTGVPVTVQSVNIDLGSGTGEITGLTIGNPEGFPSVNAFEMDLLRVGLDINSITQSPIILNELIIDSPVINIDFDRSGSNNLKQISDNVNRHSEGADNKASEEETGSEPVKLTIRKLEITGVTFNSTNLLTGNTSGTLETISKTNIGGDSGATPGAIGKEIITELAGKIITEVAGSVTKIIKDKAGDLGDKLKGVFDGFNKD